jgi:hypothetical protein
MIETRLRVLRKYTISYFYCLREQAAQDMTLGYLFSFWSIVMMDKIRAATTKIVKGV